MMTTAQLALPTMKPAAAAESTDDWYTPQKYIDAARRVLGAIDLDPASSQKAQRIVQAARYFTIADDGLAHPWQARSLWLNPPYSAPGPWVEKLIGEHEAGHVGAAILLVYVATDTSWFQGLWNYPICFVRGRIQFNNRRGRSNPRGSVFVYLGSDRARFIELFSPIGAVVERVSK